MIIEGQCYVICEAMYHMLGGKKAGFVPQVMHTSDGRTHWYLKWHGLIIDPTAGQFTGVLDYTRGRGCGFQTKRPSRRAQEIINALLAE